MKKQILNMFALALAIVVLGGCRDRDSFFNSCKPCGGGKKIDCPPYKPCKTDAPCDVCPPVTKCKREIRPVVEEVEICETRREKSLGRLCVDENGNPIKRHGEDMSMMKDKKKSNKPMRNNKKMNNYDDDMGA